MQFKNLVTFSFDMWDSNRRSEAHIALAQSVASWQRLRHCLKRLKHCLKDTDIALKVSQIASKTQT